MAGTSSVMAGVIGAVMLAGSAAGQLPVPLWPNGAPGALGSADEDTPTLTAYPPPSERATGSGIVIFPGGGYTHLSMDNEGIEVAHWLNSIGVAAFVVRYRLGPRYHYPAMPEDAERAVRLVRARAAEWHIDQHRLGVIGFSAGGHMASTVGTHFDSGNPGSADPVERQSSRPDFMILVYPVITMNLQFAHRGSRTNLLGENPSASIVRSMSNETQVTPRTPPTFLVATTDDAVVPVENTLRFYRALHAAGVPVEMHIYEHGQHGFGLGSNDSSLRTWPELCANWMRGHGWLADPQSSR